jgi:hypothetical protein
LWPRDWKHSPLDGAVERLTPAERGLYDEIRASAWNRNASDTAG